MTSEEVRNLEGEQKEEGFNTVEATINKVSHEQVVCVWHISSNLPIIAFQLFLQYFQSNDFFVTLKSSLRS